MAFCELVNVSKSYGSGAQRTEVLTDINLKIEEGEFIAIVGFSGSGKTTLISLLAGLLQADSGKAMLKDKPILGPGPDRGLVFQNYSLLPWLTVYGNVALAVDHVYSHWPPEDRRKHIEKYIEMVNLTPAMNKLPRELSGGMRQRVSVARALSIQPEILLLDEPLGALDALTRATLQREIENIWARDKRTVVLITNDVDEGILLADRIIPLKPGPRATLGPSFEVKLTRPRDRRALNHDPEFRRTRNAVMNYLVEAAGLKKNRAEKGALGALPNLQPRDLRGLSPARA